MKRINQVVGKGLRYMLVHKRPHNLEQTICVKSGGGINAPQKGKITPGMEKDSIKARGITLYADAPRMKEQTLKGQKTFEGRIVDFLKTCIGGKGEISKRSSGKDTTQTTAY